MKNILSYFIVCFIILISKTSSGQDKTITIPDAEIIVSIDHVSRIAAEVYGKDSTLYDVQIKFITKKYRSVFLVGYGNVNTNISFSYYAYNTQIELMASGRTFKVNLPVYKTAMNGTEITIPKFSDFPIEKRVEDFQVAATFEDRIRDVLQRYCIKGIIPPGESGGDYWITPFFNFYNHGSTNGQISVWISKLKIGGGKREYRIAYVARENKTHDPEWRSAGTAVSLAADGFFLNIITQTNKK